MYAAIAAIKSQNNTGDFFDSATSDRVKAGHDRVTRSSSRLLSLRNLLSSVFSGNVNTFDFIQAPGISEEKYQLKLKQYKVDIRVCTRNHLKPSGRTIHHPASALQVNKLLRHMQQEWMKNTDEAVHDDYLVVNDLIMRAFVLCSQDLRYEVETDDGYWSIYFEDSRNQAQAEITVSRH